MEILLYKPCVHRNLPVGCMFDLCHTHHHRNVLPDYDFSNISLNISVCRNKHVSLEICRCGGVCCADFSSGRATPQCCVHVGIQHSMAIFPLLSSDKHCPRSRTVLLTALIASAHMPTVYSNKMFTEHPKQAIQYCASWPPEDIRSHLPEEALSIYGGNVCKIWDWE